MIQRLSINNKRKGGCGRNGRQGCKRRSKDQKPTNNKINPNKQQQQKKERKATKPNIQKSTTRQTKKH